MTKVEIFTQLMKELGLDREKTPSTIFNNDKFKGYIQGPSETILTIEIDFTDKDMTETEIKDLFIDEIIEEMENFDPGKEFEEQYDPNCGQSAEEVKEEIWSDEEYFSDKALSIKMTTNRITEDDDLDYMLIVREKELQQEIENLNKKTNELWQDALKNKNFVSELKKSCVQLVMKDWVSEYDDQTDLIDLANYSMKKYITTKETISEIKNKGTEKQIHRIEDTIQTIRNIDK